ncbi:MAG TPA: BolA family transcriptional regulator [Porticoccaceae bacterium]|nr:BolA family transcriptional regulator [Porticoccaceae bacterium]
MGRVEASILKALTDLHPQHLDLINESHMHAVPKDSETHFKLVVVSDSFENLRLVRRHQIVYALLKEQLAGPVHALALHTYTAGEWSLKVTQVPASPDCKGGGLRD